MTATEKGSTDYKTFIQFSCKSSNNILKSQDRRRMICRACRVQAEHRIIIRKRGNNKLCNSSRLNVLNSNKGKKRAFNKNSPRRKCSDWEDFLSASSRLADYGRVTGDVELRVLGCRVDILGTNCDQCRSTVQCCFTSTETVRLIRTEIPGRPSRLSHSW